jgi:phosphoribosyl 1,2-cyclic phosphodiesterase
LKYLVLASGSRGNATYLEIDEYRFLIDCGLSLRQIQNRLSMRNIELTRLDGIFITHEHGDHVSGIVAIANKYKPVLYMTEGTYRNLPYRLKDNLDERKVRFVRFEEPIDYNIFSIRAVMSYHDALEPCGYRFTHLGKSLVYLTDSGYFPTAKFGDIANANHYIIESNHDPELLLESDRTWQLKRRILDDQGHLSNEDSAFLVCNVLGEQTKKIILAHLSEECNTESHALTTYHRTFQKQGLIFDDFAIICAKQDEPLEMEEV